MTYVLQTIQRSSVFFLQWSWLLLCDMDMDITLFSNQKPVYGSQHYFLNTTTLSNQKSDNGKTNKMAELTGVRYRTSHYFDSKMQI